MGRAQHVVVFGSARIPEAAAPGAPAAHLAPWYAKARDFARIVSQRGGALAPEGRLRDNVIATGGGCLGRRWRSATPNGSTPRSRPHCRCCKGPASSKVQAERISGSAASTSTSFSNVMIHDLDFMLAWIGPRC